MGPQTYYTNPKRATEMHRKTQETPGKINQKEDARGVIRLTGRSSQAPGPFTSFFLTVFPFDFLRRELHLSCSGWDAFGVGYEVI